MYIGIPTKTNINACRFGYEYLGQTVSELSLSYGFRPDQIEASIKEYGWTRRVHLELEVKNEAKDLEDFSQQLLTNARAKMTVAGVFQQMELQPMISAIEQTIVDKISVVAEEINPNDDKAVDKLQKLVNTLNALQQRNPIQLVEALEDGKATQGVKVYIQNNLQ